MDCMKSIFWIKGKFLNYCIWIILVGFAQVISAGPNLDLAKLDEVYVNHETGDDSRTEISKNKGYFCIKGAIFRQKSMFLPIKPEFFTFLRPLFNRPLVILFLTYQIRLPDCLFHGLNRIVLAG
jgi:hypothetical protein